MASTRTVTAGAPLRALAERLRTPLCEPGGALSALSPMEQHQLMQKAATRADVFQRSSSNGEGRNGYLSLRNHQRRGLDHPRKRTGLTAGHNFCLTRHDGTTAAARLFGQKPRCMFTAILASVACGLHRGVADAVKAFVAYRPDEHEPDPERGEIYHEAYRRYRSTYAALKPVFAGG